MMADSSVFDLEDGDSENYEPQPLASAHLSPTLLTKDSRSIVNMARPAAQKTKKVPVPKAAPKKGAAAVPKKVTTTKKRPADDDDDLDTDGDLSGTPPASKKVKKAPVLTKAGGKTKPLKPLENLNDFDDDDYEANDAKPAGKKTASETYQKVCTIYAPCRSTHADRIRSPKKTTSRSDQILISVRLNERTR